MHHQKQPEHREDEAESTVGGVTAIGVGDSAVHCRMQSADFNVKLLSQTFKKSGIIVYKAAEGEIALSLLVPTS